MEFLADTMLGRLAKWLRVLGNDTAYRPDLADPDLARLACLQNRVLLTRDLELTRRRNVQSALVASDKLSEQLAQVIRELHLHIREAFFTRCAVCNVRLKVIGRDQARAQLLPYVWETQTRYRACPRCQHVYMARDALGADDGSDGGFALNFNVGGYCIVEKHLL